MAGDVDLEDRPKLRDVLAAAKRRGVLTPEEFGALDDLRKNRNPYAHYRSFEERYRYGKTDDRRECDEFKPLSRVLETMEPDARKSLESVESLLGRDWFEELP